jgi:flagellar basal body-associated protein FliL
MADTEETIEDIEGTEEEEALEAGPQRKMLGPTMVRTLMFVAVALVVIIIAATIAFLVAKRVSGRNVPGEKRSPELAEKSAPLQTMPLDSFNINIGSRDGDEPHFLQLEIVIAFDKEPPSDFLAELGERKQEFRDIVISVVGSKYTFEDLRESGGVEELKRELRFMMNSKLQRGEIQEIYVVNFVLT